MNQQIEDKGGIALFALSTCVWCDKVKKMLHDMKIEFAFVDIDLLNETDSIAAMRQLSAVNPEMTVPTLLIGGAVVVGYDEKKINALLTARDRNDNYQGGVTWN